MPGSGLIGQSGSSAEVFGRTIQALTSSRIRIAVKLPAPMFEHFIPSFGSVLVALLSFALLCSPAIAWADVVGPPPEDCPAGTRPMSSHCGPHCIADTCSNDSECNDGESCVERSLCIYQYQGPCGNHPPDAATTTHDAVAAACPNGNACDKGTCETLDVCSAPIPPADPITIDSGCGCELVGAASDSGQGLLFFAAFIGIGIAARSRRRSA